jgi:hypothetical protein
MKHILNDISKEEKNSILEQHTGGKHLMIENFNNLVNNKLGTVKTLISEDDMTAGGPITDKIEECAQDLFGPGPILTEIPTCVWLAQYHLSTKKNKFDKNDKYDKVKIPACRRELEKAESNGEVGAVYTFPELMNCLFNCISCFSKDSIANF